MDTPYLSIIFPAYNEESAVEAALTRTLGFLDAQGWEAEVVLVNDGSTDATEARAQEVVHRDGRVRVLSHSPNRGKGYAVRCGMLAARGAMRVFLDVDMATPVETTAAAVALLEAGADVVIGTRHGPGAVIEVPQPFARRSMGWVFRRLAISVLRLRITDVTCGFKAMRGDVAEALFAVQRESGWAFDAELIYVARKWGLQVREVPVTWRNSQDTRVRALRAAWDSLRELMRIRGHDREGAYDRPAS